MVPDGAKLKGIRLVEAKVYPDSLVDGKIQSFVLQIIAGNESMKQIAVLNPVSTDEPGTYVLQTSSETELIDYFNNDAITFLLDANFTEDFEEESPKIYARFVFETSY